MAAVSAWAKPGAWALESEEHEAAAASALDKGYSSSDSHQSTTDFPSLSAAAAAATAKTPKRKKKQTLSLAEFTTGSSVSPGAGKFQPSSKTLISDELLALPTGPRERSEEELQRSRGFGYLNGGGRDRGPAGASDESRRGPAREPRDLGPSRADEVDDWGAMKKPVRGFERGERERGFFDSQSRADESDSWISKKGSAPPPVNDGRRERRGFDLFNREGSNGSGVDSDSWGKKREENGGSGWRQHGSGVDSDNWGKKREENGGSGGRPRLVLQPRMLPIVNGANEKEKNVVEVKSKGANPFGEARPREEVLKEKGKDWKEIDEKLEAAKIQEVTPPVGRKGFGSLKEERTERAWRKPEANEATPPPRADSVEEQLPEN